MASEAQTQLSNGERIVIKAPPWHAAVTLDLLFSSVASGTFIVAALLYLVSPFRFGIVCLIAFIVAFPIELADLISLIADLGDSRRFHHMLRVFKPRSPMSLGAWLSSGFAVFAFIAAVMAALVFGGMFRLLKPLRAIAAAGLVFALGVAMYKGVLLSSTAQPVWGRMRWLGAVLSISAGTCGLTVTLAIATAAGFDSDAMALRFAAGAVLAIFALALVFAMGPVNHALAPRMGGGGIVLWNALAVYVGAAIPAVLCFLPRYVAAIDYVILALTLIGALALRHVLVIIPHRVSAA